MISWFLACDVNEKNMTQANSIFPCVMLLCWNPAESCNSFSRHFPEYFISRGERMSLKN
jgi:hypothetical protein